MANKVSVPWYKPGPAFKVSDAVKEFFLLLVLTFVAGGLNAVIALLEGGQVIIPQQFVAYTGLILAILHTVYTIIVTYKNGL